MPTSQHASAQPRTRSRAICSGRASVVKSRSSPSRPSSASRTEPPTRASCVPGRREPRARARRPPAATRSSSAISRRWARRERVPGAVGGLGRRRHGAASGTGAKGTATPRRRAARAHRDRRPAGLATIDGWPRSALPARAPARRPARPAGPAQGRGDLRRRPGRRPRGARPRAALIGRLDRRGRLLWSLPKGHVEEGETAEDAAVREVEEETGIRGRVIAPLGTIDYWFVAEDRRIHKTVHHYLLEAAGRRALRRGHRGRRGGLGAARRAARSGWRTPASGGWPRPRPICSRTPRDPTARRGVATRTAARRPLLRGRSPVGRPAAAGCPAAVPVPGAAGPADGGGRRRRHAAPTCHPDLATAGPRCTLRVTGAVTNTGRSACATSRSGCGCRRPGQQPGRARPRRGRPTRPPDGEVGRHPERHCGRWAARAGPRPSTSPTASTSPA